MRALVAIVAMGCSDSLQKDTATVDSAEPYCSVPVKHIPSGQPDSVRVLGDFNDWDADSHPLTSRADGEWTTTLNLAPGAYAYRFVEYTAWERSVKHRLTENQAGIRNARFSLPTATAC